MILNTVLWMLGTIASFSLMAVAARELTGHISVYQILLTRSAIGVLIITLIIGFLKLNRRDGTNLFVTGKLPLHLLRNFFHFFGQYGWVFGIGILPLAEVFALEFTVPIWVAVIAVLFLNEKMNSKKLAAIVLGFAGVLVIVKPTLAIFESGAIIVMLAAVCYAIAHTVNKKLTNTEAPLTILFYMSLVQMPIGLAFSWGDLIRPEFIDWFWLLIIALTALFGHFCLTKAMQGAEVTVVMTLDFLRLPVIAVVGVLLYAEAFEWTLLLGGVLILLANRLNLDAGSKPKLLGLKD